MKFPILFLGSTLALLLGCSAQAQGPQPPGVTKCERDADCVPAQCCHATACVHQSAAPDCSATACTRDCRPGTLDCGAGRCECAAGACAAKLTADSLP